MSKNYHLCFRGDLGPNQSMAAIRSDLVHHFKDLKGAHMDILFSGVPAILASGERVDLEFTQALLESKGVLTRIVSNSDLLRTEDFSHLDWQDWGQPIEIEPESLKLNAESETAPEMTTELAVSEAPQSSLNLDLSTEDTPRNAQDNQAEVSSSGTKGEASPEEGPHLSAESEFDTPLEKQVEVPPLDLDLSKFSLTEIDIDGPAVENAGGPKKDAT